MEVSNENRLFAWLGKMSIEVLAGWHSERVVLVILLLCGRMAEMVSAGSASCRLGGDTACKWSCRLRGYIRGDCERGGGGWGTECSCTQVEIHNISVIDTDTVTPPQSITTSNILDYFTEKVSEKYPDLPLVTDIVKDIITNHNRTCHHSKSDGKWR